ncbi:lipopolysaccharide transport periplasmic protein LptA [Rivibacter subsaxonicus]|nr:lipopolysaccharide transport periplasmic protein LptA [Rivibacter subsaxonicus]
MLALLLAAAVPGVRAERADRNLPLNFAADSARVDDLRQVTVLSGNVEISKGSIVIRADQVEVRQSPDGYQFAVATGGPGKRASFRQKREGSEEFLEGEAERLEYDARADTVKLVNQATLRRFRGSTLADEVAGSTISFDNTTEVFQVLGGPASPVASGRVRGVLTPRDAKSSSATGSGKP